MSVLNEKIPIKNPPHKSAIWSDAYHRRLSIFCREVTRVRAFSLVMNVLMEIPHIPTPISNFAAMFRKSPFPAIFFILFAMCHRPHDTWPPFPPPPPHQRHIPNPMAATASAVLDRPTASDPSSNHACKCRRRRSGGGGCTPPSSDFPCPGR